MMGFWNRGRRNGGTAGPEGVAIRVRPHNRPEARRRETRYSMPRALALALALAVAFYVLAHYSIIEGIWPVHGMGRGAGNVLMRDAYSLAAWLLLLLGLRLLRFRGNWAVIALPIILFLITRPTLFQLFTDPVYQATPPTRAEANALKAERSQLTTILRAYGPERQQAVFEGEPPALPSPAEAVRFVAEADVGRGTLAQMGSAFSVVIAPLALLLGFLLARRADTMRWLRDHRLWPFLPTLGIFFVLTLFFTELGKVGGTTPWELFLPVFIFTWAAVLADDAYNLARPGQVLAPRRIFWLLLYGAMPVVPFLVIRELGLSIVLAGSMALMLLAGTRRSWWAGLMLAVWAVLVVIAFSVDDRSQTRLALAIEPYRDVTQMAEAEAERWAARNHQIKLFDANVLAGGLAGEGPGRGHAETAPNAADDGYITAIAAQWGWLGAMALIMLYTAFVIQMLSVAVRERSAFERSLVTGLAMLIAIPFWLATLGGIRVIPLTGVAAAFVAHGGAKLLATAVAVGLIAGISHRRAEEERLRAADAPESTLADQGVRIR
jgi:cell division protein FtsW (lipid II flippase)